jgi:DNA-binding MurR/RpiR family transcriptional regulator
MTRFDDRVLKHLAQLGPAEQRAVRYFQDNREEVLMASAATLAAKAKTSDATVVRAARRLGFAGLEDLRRALAGEMRQSPSPAERLTRVLGEVGENLSSAFELALTTHLRSLESLRRTISPKLFESAIDGIVAADRVVVFGIGPSSAMANYLVIQLGRFGRNAISLTNTGLLFADDLQRLRQGDLVIILAYSRLYAELDALLDEIKRHGLMSCLITDTLAAMLKQRVDLILPVPRGSAESLSLHTATLGFIEALLVGIATRQPRETLESLEALNDAREKLAGKRMGLPTSK